MGEEGHNTSEFWRESIKLANLRNLASLSMTKASILFGNAAFESFSIKACWLMTFFCEMMTDEEQLWTDEKRRG